MRLPTVCDPPQLSTTCPITHETNLIQVDNGRSEWWLFAPLKVASPLGLGYKNSLETSMCFRLAHKNGRQGICKAFCKDLITLYLACLLWLHVVIPPSLGWSGESWYIQWCQGSIRRNLIQPLQQNRCGANRCDNYWLSCLILLMYTLLSMNIWIQIWIVSGQSRRQIELGEKTKNQKWNSYR